MDLVSIAISVLIILALIYWFGVKDYAVLSDIPVNGPKPWPYIGNLPDIIRDGGMHKTLWKYFKRFGRVYKFYIGRRPGLVVTDPEMIKMITVKEFDKFRNRPEFLKLNPPLSFGVGFAQDNTWKRIRTIITPTFSAAKLKQVLPIMQACTDELEKKMETFSRSGENVNITRMFSLYALDVIMKSAFGYDIDVQNQPNDEFLIAVRAALNVPLWKRAFTMFPFSDSISKAFDIQILSGTEYFVAIARKMISSRQQQGSVARRDFLQLMLEAHEEQVDGKSKLSDEELAAQCLVFLLAGYETSSTTLTSTAYFLATYPEFQEALLQELDKARENSNHSSLYDLAHHIDYLDKIVCEVLRLCTPGFNLIRTCNEDVVIKGVRFRKGVDVNIPNYCLHRDPEAWERPDDFYPEHFSAEARSKRSPYSYMPFGNGPRQCIGMRFALTEVKSTLLAVMKKYKFERCPQTADLEHRSSVLMLPKNDVVLKIKRR